MSDRTVYCPRCFSIRTASFIDNDAMMVLRECCDCDLIFRADEDYEYDEEQSEDESQEDSSKKSIENFLLSPKLVIFVKSTEDLRKMKINYF